MLAIVTPVLLFIAFFLLLLVSLSVPVIKSIFLFKLIANVGVGLLKSGVSGSVTFGVWGYCVSGVKVSVLGVQSSTAASCTKIKLGYTFDSTVSNALGVSGFENVISRILTAVLVINPVACGLAFLAFLVSLASLVRLGSSGFSRVASLFILMIGMLAAVITTIIFIIDVVLVASVRNKIKNETNGDLQLNFGSAVWLVLGALIAIWVSLFTVWFGRRKFSKSATY